MNTTNPNQFDSKNLNLDEYLEIIRRRKYVLLMFLIFVMVATMLWTFIKPPIYEAIGTLMIGLDSKNIVFKDSANLNMGNWDEEFVTQVKILKSRTIASSVIKELNLLKNTPETFQKSNFKELMDSNDTHETGQVEDEITSAQMAGQVDQFLGNLSINNVLRSRIVEVRFKTSSPKMAARVVNTLFQKYISFNLEFKTESTKLASEFLTRQISEIRKTISQKEKELQSYGKTKELYYLSDNESTITKRFSDLNKVHTEAQVERINAEAIYLELKGKSFNDYPEVRKNSLIQNLKEQYASLDGQYNKKKNFFKPSYPEMEQLNSQLKSLQMQIKKETIDIGRKALDEAEANFKSALKKEMALITVLGQEKVEVAQSNSSSIYYNNLKVEVQNMKSLLDQLIKKEKEALLNSRLEGLQTSNIKVIDQAEAPQIPIFPQRKKLLVFALFLGLFGGIFLIFTLDWLDKTIKTSDDIERLVSTPILGIIPDIHSKIPKNYSTYTNDKGGTGKSHYKRIEFINSLAPDSFIAESFRNIRSSILLSTPDHVPKVIAATSTMPMEGKTSTILNLAISFSNLKKQIILIDADLRRPRIHQIFTLKNSSGLSSYLCGRDQITDIIFKSHIPNLFIIPSGPPPPNPSELLNGKTLKLLIDALKNKFDFIFIDTPPLQGISDTAIIGKNSDGLFLVAWSGKTQKQSLLKIKNMLESYDIPILGIVLNKVMLKNERHYPYYTKKNNSA